MSEDERQAIFDAAVLACAGTARWVVRQSRAGRKGRRVPCDSADHTGLMSPVL